ncbi:hypothetical protein CPB84DRAFT_1792366, partial [Gymnopilus junonius]
CLDVKGWPVSHVKPWENITIHPKPDPDWADKREDTQWWLPDDPPSYQEYYDDSDGWKSKFYFCENILPGEKQADHEEVELDDIWDLVRNVTSAGIVHGDLRFCNVMQATQDVICPQHECAHHLSVWMIGQAYFWGLL